MTENDRQMWADLYHFYERCEKTDPSSPEWKGAGKEANRICQKYGEDNFLVRDILSTTLSWFLQKSST